MSRRSFLAAGGLVAIGGGLALAADMLDRIGPGARRFTGSRELPAGGIPPTTTFFGEPTPATDVATWRVRSTGAVERPASWTLDELRGLGEADLTAILDCTSGWWIETGWHGIPLGALIDAAGAKPGAGRVVRPLGDGLVDIAADRRGPSLPPCDRRRRHSPARWQRRPAPARRTGPSWTRLGEWVDRIEVA